MSLDSPLRHSGRPFRSPLHRRRRLTLVWGAAVLVILASVTFAVIRSESAPWFQSPVVPAAGPTEGAAAGIPEGLESSIDRILDDANGYRVGVALGAVADGEIRTYGDDSAFVTASTAKLITAAAYYHLVETGAATLEERLGDYDAGFQLEAMINTSSNDSWLLLMDAIGYPRIIEYAASIGITYDPEQNTLAPSEMASFLQKLYSGELLNREDTEELLSYMRNTNDEELIPAAARPDITVHHKYGRLDGNLHDAALLSFRDTTYALVIYTEGADAGDGADRIELIHELTKTVIDALFPPSVPGL